MAEEAAAKNEAEDHAADHEVTLVIHQPSESPFDEQMNTEQCVSDLVDRVRRRLQADEGTRIRLICAGAVLQEAASIGKAVRFREGVSVYHVHCAVHTPQPELQLQARVHRPDIVDEDGALLGHHMHGIPAFDEGEVLLNTARTRQADLIWGFSLGLVLGVLTLFILVDRAMPRMMQTGIMLGVSCNLLFSGFGSTHGSAHDNANVAQDESGKPSRAFLSSSAEALRDESTSL